MALDKLTIQELKEMARFLVNRGSIATNDTTQIAVLQRGWVAVGKFFQDGEVCRLEKAKHIRQWGTSKGLGELAMNGPTKNTTMDESPTIRFHELTIVQLIECNEDVWRKFVK
jgi:hypothetical protein